MIKPIILFAAVIYLVLGLTSFAQADSASGSGSDFEKGISKTQRELKEPTKRKSLLNTPEAKATDGQIQELTENPAQQQAIYDISAEALGDLSAKSPEELMQLIAEAQKDPKGFFQKLPPATQKKIRELAGQIEASKKKKP